MCQINNISLSCVNCSKNFYHLHDKMSGQAAQRVRKSSPCSSKQGPLRATLPMSSLMRQGSNLRKSKSNSPTLSPTSSWKTRISPDSVLSGQRSPGSLSYRGKSKTLNSRTGNGYNSGSSSGGGSSCVGVISAGGSTGCIIRRTASLDTIYLKGQWPRDSFYMYCGHLLVDKATQTTEEWSSEQRKPHRYLDSCGNEDKVEKYFRHRLQRTTNKDGVASGTNSGGGTSTSTGSGGRERSNNPVHGDHSVLSSTQISSLCGTTNSSPAASIVPMLQQHTKGIPIPSISKPLVPRMRNSIEGLNQEIERLVLKGMSSGGSGRVGSSGGSSGMGLAGGGGGGTGGSGHGGCSSSHELEREEDKYTHCHAPTPEGHRAPLADLLRSTTRSVNTQTPGGREYVSCVMGSGGGGGSSGGGLGSEGVAGGGGGSSSQSSGPPSRDSVSPLIPGQLDISRPPSIDHAGLRGGSRGSSPDQEAGKFGTSPHINKFLAREPPDGCEKVNLKFVEDTRRPMIDLSKMDYCPLKPCVTFQLKPSLGSAFHPLSSTSSSSSLHTPSSSGPSTSSAGAREGDDDRGGDDDDDANGAEAAAAQVDSPGAAAAGVEQPGV
ncbi:protein FAM117B-like [Ischnura elegans]|uniref:protein FAM117B-like n=1 Tax=Ischnura elegans TaxID=197161 RepID=UPI001ED8A7A7|nr:protein FAM117B-like [Ischnura elegans]